MIESVLIANRGEIARRIIRTAKRLGIRTIAVHSDVDSAMPFVREADEAVCIGPAPARESYLGARKSCWRQQEQREPPRSIPAMAFCRRTPNSPRPFSRRRPGLDRRAAGGDPRHGAERCGQELMHEAGVPVTPGYMGDDQSAERLQNEAGKIGYPVLIKAVAGGGGKGMRKVDAAAGLCDALDSCRREATASFGDDRVLIEKYVERPRHIEVQVFGDSHGNVVHLFERDCSLQRRHQKVIEEAPAPGMDADFGQSSARPLSRQRDRVDYVGAGTVEFIADASRDCGRIASGSWR